MTRRFLFAAGAFALGLAAAPALQAQATSCNVGASGSCSLPHLLTGTVPTIATLTMSDNETSFDPPTAAEFGTGGQIVTGPNLSVQANTGYAVTVTPAAAFTGSGRAKPVSEVSYFMRSDNAVCAAGSYSPLAAGPIGLFSSGTAGSSGERRLCFQILWNIELDTPGSYDLDMSVSLSAP